MAVWPSDVRKTVTILFCDVTGSTDLGERLDPEALRRVMFRFFDEMRAVLERHGGTVEKFAGDDVMAVFGVPTLHEDDALRAVNAAAAMHEALARLNDELERGWGVRLDIRIGINTGEVVTAGELEPSEKTLATGEAVNTAKRIQQAAEPGEILIGKATYPLVKDAVTTGPLETLPAKGGREQVGRLRVHGVEPGAPGVARRFDVPLVDRETELAALQEAFAHAVAERRCRLLTVLGPAGIGKSRLAAELTASVTGDATALTGRCLPYGEGITFWPLSQVVRGAGGEDGLRDALAGSEDAELVLELVRAAIGSSPPRSNQETFWAVRRVFEALARERPLVVCFEDLHWAEPTFLDLIEYLVGWSRSAPILILCQARPELVEARPTLVTTQANVDAVTLEPLSAADAEALLARLGGEAEFEDDVRERITQAAEGNPLFVEQMAARVAERNGNGNGALPIPPTIQALLAERLDRLPPAELAVVERASVIGLDFPVHALAELSPADERAALTGHLLSLVRKGLMRPETGQPSPEDRFRFHHVLVRDAAYQAMPKELRAELHERLAAWVEKEGPRSELDELVGYHLEQAHALRSQLGPTDPSLGTLARRAADRLASAGTRAFERGDIPAAVALLTRASVLLREDDDARLPVSVELAAALMQAGEYVRADAIATTVVDAARASGNRRLEARARSERAWSHVWHGRLDDAEAEANRALAASEEMTDELGLTRAWTALGAVHWTRCRFAAAEAAFAHALRHAERAGHRRETASRLNALAGSLVFGPTHAEEALRRCRALLEAPGADLLSRSATQVFLGYLLAMRGRFDDARASIVEAIAVCEELGLEVRRAEARWYSALVELLAGKPEAAERELRLDYELLERAEERGSFATHAASLAEALCDQGRYEEAVRYTEVSELATAAGNTFDHVSWRRTRGRALALAGDLDRAATLGEEAVTLAVTTDSLNLQADAALDLARVYRAIGTVDRALVRAEEAESLYEAKGNVVGRTRASEVLVRLRREAADRERA